MKDKLRAWLIDLVREAIRIERVASQIPVRATPSKPARTEPKPQPIHVDTSFEQMQAEALKAQEKYYEPERT